MPDGRLNISPETRRDFESHEVWAVPSLALVSRVEELDLQAICVSLIDS